MQSEFLCARDVCKEYKMQDGALRVLNGVNLSIAKGEIVAIIGSSGAGKSTLLHILGTLDQPTSGAVIYNGVNLNEISAKEQAVKRNKIFGFVFQFYYLMPDFSALENVMMPVLIGRSFSRKNFNKKQCTEKAMALLEQVGLKDRMNHMPEQLSGGERQRVAITRALINDPEILLCDEPTGNLDSKTGQNIKELLWDINERLNQTIVIVSHDDQIAKSAHRTIHIADGKISNN
ncbi:MAG: ABC transporter ATP-binding protein [Candidatus Anammoxibacter sp.]